MSSQSEDNKQLILVIDDEAEILEFYRDLLVDNYRVLTFEGPTEFIKYFDDDNAERPKLVVTDYNLPSMHGLEMIKRIQKRGISFPFILISGYLNKENILQAVDIGVFRLIEKPVDAEVLLSAIEQLLLESDIVTTRNEIRDITSQLRELYTGIRLIMDQYIPIEVLNRLIVEDMYGSKNKQMSFNDLLEKLETRLELLLDNEKLYSEIKSNKFKSETN